MKKIILGLSLVLLASPVLAKTSTATQWHLASKQWIVDVRVDDFTDEKKWKDTLSNRLKSNLYLSFALKIKRC